MFSWITGPRVTNVIEDLQADAGYETTFIEPPETPAHQFAVKAFKHAIFGTPAPAETNNADSKTLKQQASSAPESKVPKIAPPKESGPPLSPTKQPGGILRTPMTANKAQKTVSFGAQVVDNEGKRVNAGKSGIPSDCPGKFPSPWTPGTELKSTTESEKKPPSKFTTALLEARTTPQLKPGHKAKARDDSDITMDLGAPRSESGKYWKQQYESYAEKSETEVKKLVAKQQLAKNFARKKDGEVNELLTKLEQERRHHKQRETELQGQNRELQERLRKATDESMNSRAEVAALKSRIATLGQSIVAPSSEVLENKPSFQIYEDSSKNTANISPDLDTGPEASYLSQRSRASKFGKENSPPKSRNSRRQTLPDISSRPEETFTDLPRLGVGPDLVSTILAKSPRTYTREPKAAPGPGVNSRFAEPLAKAQLRTRRTTRDTENMPPKSPETVVPSSPLPIPSPGLEDPWMLGADESSIAPADKFALPISSGPSTSRPIAGARHPRRSATLKPLPNKTDTSRPARKLAKHVPSTAKVDTALPSINTEQLATGENKSTIISPLDAEGVPAIASSSFDVALPSPTDLKFDITKLTAHHAEGSSQVKRDRVQMPVDRKAEAKRRLLEKKQRKGSAKP